MAAVPQKSFSEELQESSKPKESKASGSRMSLLSRGKSFLRGEVFSSGSRLHPQQHNAERAEIETKFQKSPRKSSSQVSHVSLDDQIADKKNHLIEARTFDLLEGLKSYSLEATHGLLHSAGMRKLSDLRSITPYELLHMQFSHEHFIMLTELIRILNDQANYPTPTSSLCAVNKSEVSRSGVGVFEIPFQRVDFHLTAIDKDNQIYKGRFMNVEQCQHIVRMAELYAYKNTGWRPEIYTLTNLDLHVKAIPGMLDLVHPFMQQLMDDMHMFFKGCAPGTTNYRNDNEPHLVKYTGNYHQGVCMHTDSADVTVNIALSDPADFEGGGTYFESIDENIVLQQGEMLVHVGPLKHSGVDISAGIRTILVLHVLAVKLVKHSVVDGAWTGLG